MCFGCTSSDFVFWQNLLKTKQNQTKKPNHTTLAGHSHEVQLPFFTWPPRNQGGLYGRKGGEQHGLWLPGGGMPPAAAEATWPPVGFCNTWPTPWGVILHPSPARYSRLEEYFLCSKAPTEEITQKYMPADKKEYIKCQMDTFKTEEKEHNAKIL